VPIRTGNSSARCAATAASTADLGEANAATTPSPVWLNRKPSCASIAVRSTSSCASRAARIASASASHRRVEPSISVNSNVTPPVGGSPADTRTECHTKPSSIRQSRLTFETLEFRLFRDHRPEARSAGAVALNCSFSPRLASRNCPHLRCSRLSHDVGELICLTNRLISYDINQ
jgi:hypothetical protein